MQQSPSCPRRRSAFCRSLGHCDDAGRHIRDEPLERRFRKPRRAARSRYIPPGRRIRRTLSGTAGATRWPPTTAVSTRACGRSTTWLCYDLEGNRDGFLLAIDAVRNAAGEIVCGVNADADPSNDRPDCVPINVFGPAHRRRKHSTFVNMTGTRDERAEQFVVSAYVSGDLPLIATAGWPARVCAGRRIPQRAGLVRVR